MSANMHFTAPSEENVRVMFLRAQNENEAYLLLVSNPGGDHPYYCESITQKKELPMAHRMADRTCQRIVMELDTQKDFDEQWNARRLAAMN